jgi:hypothetical protein
LLFRAAVTVAFMLGLLSWESLGAESNSPPLLDSSATLTNSQATPSPYLQLIEQLRATQLAVEQNRQEIKEATAQNAEAVSKALQTIQETFAAQRARDLEATRRSNKVLLMVAGTFAVVGFLTMLLIAFFQWRMSEGLARITAALPAALGLEAGSTVPALAPVEPSSSRLLGALEQHEKRIHELEEITAPAPRLPGGPGLPNGPALFVNGGVAQPRKRPIPALRTAIIVGLICAAVLALIFYLVAYKKPGLGHLHSLFGM